MKRRFEFEIGQLFNDLVQVLMLDPYSLEDGMYEKLTSATLAEMAIVRAKFNQLMPSSASKELLFPLCQRVWLGIQGPIEDARQRMIDVLLDHGIFVTIDVQPSLSKNVFKDFVHLVPAVYSTLSFQRLQRIITTIRGEMTSRQLFNEKTRAEIGEYLMRLLYASGKPGKDEHRIFHAANIDKYMAWGYESYRDPVIKLRYVRMHE